MITTFSARSPYVKTWLFICMAMVVTMVFVGGVTRLTQSGLSIVEWELITGILPPLSQEGWEAELDKYRDSPEYQQVNKGMNVDEFKQIYWLEWLHRLLGRITGLVFLLPLIYFAAKRKIDRPLTIHMTLAGVFVAMQGTVGWIMVASGLQDEPRVHPIKLALHLSLAFFVFCWIFWAYMRLRGTALNVIQSNCGGLAARGLLAIIVIQIVLGAFVAGMDAGMIYNTWPLMDGAWMPPILFSLEPWYLNLVEYVPMVQWQHRTFAYVVTAATLGYVAYMWRDSDPQQKKYLRMLLAVLALQVLLGILTIIYVVPISLASAHQLAALVLLASCVHQCYARPLNGAKRLQSG